MDLLTKCYFNYPEIPRPAEAKLGMTLQVVGYQGEEVAIRGSRFKLNCPIKIPRRTF
jgi:hypothetical protein